MRRKERLVQKKASALIGPSNWVCRMASQSIIGRGIATYAIPNIIDDCFFAALSRRERNGRFVILFGAYGGRKNGFKGFADLQEALSLLPDDVKFRCELQIFGEDAEPCDTGGVRTTFLGNVSDPIRMCEIYCAADVFAFPSLQETQGMTKVEAMVCGLPVVAFDRTACAEGIEDGRSGRIVADGDCMSYAKGIVNYFRVWEQDGLMKLRMEMSQTAVQQFSNERIVRQILSVYQKISMEK